MFSTALAANSRYVAPTRNPAYVGGGKRIDGFTDVNMHWARENIAYAVDKGLMNGMTTTEFWPNYQMTRAMVVTVLWRLEGSPKPSRPAPFADVDINSWYDDAVAWAYEMDIVEGMGDNLFMPKNPISRQDFCVMLMRFAEATDRNEPEWMPVVVFTDGDDIAEYAQDAVNWCSCRGIVRGRPAGEFSPRATTTRAEACTMLREFLEQD